MKTSNPTLNDRFFKNMSHSSTNHMTIDGTINQLFLFLILLILSAAMSWLNADILMPFFMPIFLVVIIVTLILAIVIAFNQKMASTLGYIYAILEGVLIGLLSLMFEMQFPGIVLQAVGLTFGCAFVMLLAYKNRIIKVTEKFRSGVIIATMSIFFVYLVSIILGFFGINVPLIHSNGLFGILFSLFVVTLASFNLLLDFDFIERASHNKLPKYMESYGAFALLVTLVWLYIEVLRLLSKLRSRN